MSTLTQTCTHHQRSASQSGHMPGINTPSVIAHLMQEAADLRRKVTNCKNIEDQIANYQLLISKETNVSKAVEDDLRSRFDSSVNFIQTLKAEIEAQQRMLADRKR